MTQKIISQPIDEQFIHTQFFALVDKNGHVQINRRRSKKG